MIWEWPEYVSDVLLLIQYLISIYNDNFIDENEFKRIMELHLEEKIEEIKKLEVKVQAIRIFRANAEWMQKTVVKELEEILKPQELEVYSGNLASVDNLYKDYPNLLSEKSRVYLKNLSLEDLQDTLELLIELLPKINSIIQSIKDDDARNLKRLIEKWLMLKLSELQEILNMKEKNLIQKIDKWIEEIKMNDKIKIIQSKFSQKITNLTSQKQLNNQRN